MIEFLRERLSADGLAVYPEYGEARQDRGGVTSASRRSSSLFTNGTDEAIQVFINTYVDDGDEVLVLRPSYAMYRFYAEVAGAKIREIDYRADGPGVSARERAGRHHARHARRADRESEQPDRHGHRRWSPSSAS